MKSKAGFGSDHDIPLFSVCVLFNPISIPDISMKQLQQFQPIWETALTGLLNCGVAWAAHSGISSYFTGTSL